jgi:hypothetical protein
VAAAGVDVAKAVSLAFKGGDRLKGILDRMVKKSGNAKSVSIGFLDRRRYPAVHGIRGTPRSAVPVAQVAFWNEFGTNPAGRPGIPPRPFFRTMIEDKSPKWGASMAYLVKAHQYDAKAVLTSMGIGIQGQLVESIREWNDPANSAATVAIKGFNKPLVDEGIMQNSVSYEVATR